MKPQKRYTETRQQDTVYLKKHSGEIIIGTVVFFILVFAYYMAKTEGWKYF
jgi:hypothetical protein